MNRNEIMIINNNYKYNINIFILLIILKMY